MRRYDVVSGILFILSIIDFALAAPVLVQEKRQACVDVVHIPKDVITVLEKRGDEELERLVQEYFKSIRKAVESSDAHTKLTPPGYHGSTSTANPDPLMEPSGPSSTAPMQGDDELHGPLHTPTSTEHGLDHELTGAHAPQPELEPKKRPLTDDHWMNHDYPPPPTRRPAPPKEFGQADENQVEHVQQPNAGPSTVSNFGWPKTFKFGQVERVQQPNAGPSTVSNFDLPKEFKFGPAHGNQAGDVGPSTVSNFDRLVGHMEPSTVSNFDWPKEFKFGQAHEDHISKPDPSM